MRAIHFHANARADYIIIEWTERTASYKMHENIRTDFVLRSDHFVNNVRAT